MKYARLATLLLFAFSCHFVSAQENNLHHQSSSYQWPSEPDVRAKLDKWQDLKFGILIHWGIYAVPGIIESWQICSEPWIERDSTSVYEDYKKWYWGLSKDFNPTKFNPEQWAQAAKDAGMRYLVFTTKHHDGFNMFDTRQTDYKITNGPFGVNPRADVAKYVFQAFRDQGFMIGAYFSKPDWHSQDFWWSKYATPDRNVNYDIRKYPWKWSRFKQFTYNQISELMHNYGSIDLLWLDGGWVRPLETVTDEVRAWGAAIPTWSQEVDIPRIAKMAREAQPGLLVVDRTVAGPYENYQTPEQAIPDKALDHPWESCITLGNAWGWVPNEQYKSPTKVIHKLIEIVAKGGSLLLGVGPRADGTIEPEEVALLKQIGGWLKINGDAIYGTRESAVFRDGETFFTQSKDGKVHYALVRLPEGENVPKKIEWRGNIPQKETKMKLLATGACISWKRMGDKVVVDIPNSFLKKGKYPALAFSF
ncbi:MAG: alpha-L-fucosidase [Bacteroidales bacterium 45-6]|nr:MAG: alpha-L-fucosidase [Bacteroidales bacterium 45-6]